MLKLYNKEHIAISALTNLKDYKIEYLLSGEDQVEFSLSNCDENINLVKEEGYVRNKYNEYVIKAINPSQNFKRFTCIVNVESIKAKAIKNFDTSNNTIDEAIRLAIAGTGWILADNNISKRRTVRVKNTDALGVLREIRKVFMIDYRFDAINKVIYVYEHFGSDRGAYFSDELNLKTLTVPSDTYDYATRLYCYGKEGLNITSINSGKEYIENFQYSNKIIEKMWTDDRYTVVENLKEDAIAKLEELSKPKRNYQADILDLAKMSDEYKFLDFFLGDNITLLSKSEKFKDKQRIVKYIEYPHNPSKNTCELGNTTLTFEELQKENEAKNQVVDNITTDNGTVNGETVEGLKSKQIIDFEASVAKVTNLTVINADISNLKAQNVTITGKLTAIEGEFGTLTVNVATIDKLTVTHTAQINNLIATKADITDLNAVNATIQVLEAQTAKIETLLNGNLSSENIQAGGITSDKLTIANGFIKNAMIDSLDVSKVNAGDISTNKFKIKSDDGGIEIVGATQQFKDKNNKVRIQMGKDTQGNFNFIIRGEDGTSTLIDHTGVKEKAIADDLIKSNMIASDAVGEKQIDYNSFSKGFNKDTNTTTLKATKIKLDNQNQTLDIAFNQLKTQSDETKSLTESHSTTIGVIQGQISTAINNTQIVKEGQTILLKDDYNRTVATVDSMKSTIGSHTTQINSATGKINSVETKVNTVERNLNSITARVSNTEITTTSLTAQLNQVDGKINTAKNQAIADARGIKDTRNNNESPGWYFGNYPKQSVTEFKYARVVGIPNATDYAYGVVITNVPWQDSSGGYPVQTFRSNSYPTYQRVGVSNDAWGPWKQVEDTEGSQNKANDALNSAKSYANVEITKTNNKVASIETNLSSITSRVSSVETTNANVNGQISNLSARMNTAEQKITDSSIISTVSSQFYKKDETNSIFASKTELKQTADEFNMKFSQTGGMNEIQNSKCYNSTDFWNTGGHTGNPVVKLHVRNPNIQFQVTGYGSAGGIQTDSISVIEGSTHTLAFDYNILRGMESYCEIHFYSYNNKGFNVYPDRGKVIVTGNQLGNNGSIKHTFKVPTGTKYMKFYFYTAYNGTENNKYNYAYFTIYDLRCFNSSIAGGWQSAPNEVYAGNIKFNERGIEQVYNNKYRSRWGADALEFLTPNGTRKLAIDRSQFCTYNFNDGNFLSYFGATQNASHSLIFGNALSTSRHCAFFDVSHQPGAIDDSKPITNLNSYFRVNFFDYDDQVKGTHIYKYPMYIHQNLYIDNNAKVTQDLEVWGDIAAQKNLDVKRIKCRSGIDMSKMSVENLYATRYGFGSACLVKGDGYKLELGGMSKGDQGGTKIGIADGNGNISDTIWVSAFNFVWNKADWNFGGHNIYDAHVYSSFSLDSEEARLLKDTPHSEVKEDTLYIDPVKSCVELVKENNQLKNEVVTSMLASTEMFEMMLNVIPQTLDNIRNVGNENIIEVYATLVTKKEKNIEDIPVVIKDSVIEKLKQLEVQI